MSATSSVRRPSTTSRASFSACSPTPDADVRDRPLHVDRARDFPPHGCRPALDLDERRPRDEGEGHLVRGGAGPDPRTARLGGARPNTEASAIVYGAGARGILPPHYGAQR